MKKNILILIFIISFQIFIVGCTSKSKQITSNEEKIKETIDLVLSYENGYDETMKKHISEKNFYVCNYLEFYSLYVGDLELEKYESDIVSIKYEDGKYNVCLVINLEGKSLEAHEHEGEEHEGEELRDEVIGEDVPVEVILKEKDDEFYIESFTEYESLEKAKELNDGFK